jgi:hypothetical protein
MTYEQGQQIIALLWFINVAVVFIAVKSFTRKGKGE